MQNVLLFYRACRYNSSKQKRDEELLMREIQLESGPSSAATHRLTQPSTTLNRRYVGRPSNLAIEEAASVAPTESRMPTVRPSRLVNLRVSTADIDAAKAEVAARKAAEAALRAENQARSAVVPQVVEFGQDMHRFVPAEASEGEPQATVYTTNTAPSITTIQQETTTIVTVPEPANSTIMNSSSVDTDNLAMSIAADYAAASMGASMSNSLATMNSNSSIDEIAQAVSAAIASIRTATDADEIAEQIASLKAFAETLKSDNSMPEMAELSDTIEKFVSIAMKSTKVKEEAVNKKVALSSKATRAANKVTKSSAKVIAKSQAAAKKTTPRPAAKVRTASPKATAGMRRTASRVTANTRRVSTTEDQALRQALRSVAAMDNEPETSTGLQTKTRRTYRKGGAKRFLLAFTCAAACVAAIIYFVGSNVPDISVRVAAMQTGVEASYPSYVPRDFSLSDIDSENGKITLTFKGPEGASFTLIEEKSSWDSSALLRNYVEPTWKENYTTTHEQGITIYTSGANAAWVNRGVLYKINASADSLTKKQLRNIVVSI